MSYAGECKFFYKNHQKINVFIAMFLTILSFCSKLAQKFSCPMSVKVVQLWRSICSNCLLSKNLLVYNKNRRKLMLFRHNRAFSCAILSGVSCATLQRVFATALLSQEYYDIVEQDFFMWNVFWRLLDNIAQGLYL